MTTELLLKKSEVLKQKSVNKVSKLIFDTNIYKTEESVRGFADKYIEDYTITKADTTYEIINNDNAELDSLREVPMFEGVTVVLGDEKQKEESSKSKKEYGMDNESKKRKLKTKESTSELVEEISEGVEAETVQEVIEETNPEVTEITETIETTEVTEDKPTEVLSIEEDVKQKYDVFRAWYNTTPDSPEQPASLAVSLAAGNEGLPLGVSELLGAFEVTLQNIMLSDSPDLAKVNNLVNDFGSYLNTLCQAFVANANLSMTKAEFFKGKEEETAEQLSNEVVEVETPALETAAEEVAETTQEEKPAEVIESGELSETQESTTGGATTEEELKASKGELANNNNQVTELTELVQGLSKKLEAMENLNKESILNLETKLVELTKENKTKEEKIKKLEAKPVPSNSLPETYTTSNNSEINYSSNKLKAEKDAAYEDKRKRDLLGIL